VRRAPATGWRVRATWLNTPPAGEAEWVRCDIRAADATRAAADGVDAIVHTAYVQGGDDEWQANVDGTASVAAAAHGRRLVHLSSDIVFAGTKGSYREDDEPAPVNSYGRSKLEAERRVASHGDAAIVRTSLIYGGAQPGPQERLAAEGSRFFVDEIRSPVQAGDLADAVLELLTLAHTGPIHLGGADDLSRFDFAVLLGADPGRIEPAQTTADRAPNVSLDSSLAGRLLQTRLRGAHEVLGHRFSSVPKRSSWT
jgi:dTDP-4-dehydrorhamnose reductase